MHQLIAAAKSTEKPRPAGSPPVYRAPAPHKRTPLLLSLMWVAQTAALIWFAAQDVGLEGQYLLGAAALVGLAILHLVKPTGVLRVMLIMLVGFMSIRYFTWRTLYTIPPVDSSGFIAGLLLYLAELQGMVVYVLGMFVNIRPLNRAEAPLPEDPELLPTVDILVPSYNEEADLLRVTLMAATQIDYPAHKMAIHLLDDGGTLQKRRDADPRKAAEALERHEVLQALCAELGVNYLTRERNNSAKAGNINAALAHTDGDLILILDADHVPTQDILRRTVGHFLKDQDLFLVQTPHFFINPDPIEHNLGTFGSAPSENEMFYGVIQKGLDSWNASFFCGSAAVLRRTHLMSVGGIAGTSITEDAETALDLHAKGFKSIYVDRPMVAGLSPETFSSFIVQRTRWAQGMFQILLLKNPAFKRGLTVAQRLCYLSSSTFWLFPFARLTFLVAPLFYLIFGLKVFEASLEEFYAFAVFHVVCSLMMSNFLFGKHRRPFVSDLYELLQAVFTFGALLSVLVNPRKPTFKVTPKAETVDQDFVSQLVKPFAVILAILLGSTAVGVYRWIEFPLEREHLAIVMAWHFVNIVLATGAFGVMFEKARHQVAGAIPRSKPLNFVTPEGAVRATLIETTIEKGRILVEGVAANSLAFASGKAAIQLIVPGREDLSSIPVVVEGTKTAGHGMILDVKYMPRDIEDDGDLVRLCYGDSSVWVAFQEGRQKRVPILMSLLGLFVRGLKRCLSMTLFGRSSAKKRAALGAPLNQPIGR
ncbi:cellulose synthase [Skermanella stibiiresistens SB22]|uniref:Cellulose synthase catalytic subunit [UDP-forming] n=1 Tax=Skermanella stibiiresistens SB22 TaxID=1385369 RepID=W9H5X1_9PROT|nr:UDP-forming cellulose synthase catalytic subunit [Skermanella stibiiresistens]EWY39143.1 cellulose synthase [Skermanella stibiiresistens SB22]